ncbi:Asp-tRNA(Asn)/Glu-tRNA(Gln) amidotransferase GatCAB subunit C [Putridiphycobacter roseus]|uniref:Aspartyl/glutamyl-tRNA(Asn/Gln) amidotransferase subunit C n=1 Tax=Putridiphycobacter roseus TaxID=2219161 RepID=A0A2W1NE77_9FLAO|nr:Asp-tRNA(Asn)/Glu-tRNA(Gln) amidotransferase subunit GatC [Putridiphycobacter roseus]PZE16366.1 Asp-tRNA(Asn)/Glu-tRNA(Gln) amidotransferase GatCAB subunit C [Putridiphycobacter roseus]
MDITDDLIDHIAHLSRLNFDGDKKTVIKNDMEKMIQFVDQLNKIDTEDVEPLIFMSEAINVLREDIVKSEITQEEALKNATHKDSDYFKIAKVLDVK